MSKIRINGAWKVGLFKFFTGGAWRDTCLKKRILGNWKDDNCALKLTMPAPANGNLISLKAFIDARNPTGKKKIIITNTHTQPSIITGNLSAFSRVTFINSGDILGRVPGATALTVTSPIILENTANIKGAGGSGGKGGKSGTYSFSGSKWGARTDRYSGGSKLGERRWYGNWLGSGSAARWVQSDGSNQRQSNTMGLVLWGDQTLVKLNCCSHGNRKKHPSTSPFGSFFFIRLPEGTSGTFYGGNGGNGGNGQSFTTTRSNGVVGVNATKTGSSTGFNTNTGFNFTKTLADYKGGTGGNGSVWAVAGLNGGGNGAGGNGAGANGAPGQPAGLAISGLSNIDAASILGNIVGGTSG